MKRSFFALCLVLLLWAIAESRTTAAESLFQQGMDAYNSGDFAVAADAFRKSADQTPAVGTFVNLGIAEWRRGRAGPAVLAWEQALWLDASNADAKNNLEFARRVAQLEQPELTWYESVSTWLSPAVWAWIASVSFWVAIAMMTLPQVLRWRKAGWHQALAALGLVVCALSLPAQIGVFTRTRIGFILEPNTALRLTPTDEGETISILAAGGPLRTLRQRGTYVLVDCPRASGWIERRAIGLVCPDGK